MRLQWWCARRRCCTDGQQQQQHRRCIAICATNAKWHPTYAQLVCHCRYTCSNMCEALVNHIFIQFNSFSFSLSLSVTVCVCFYISLYSLWPQKRISHRNLGIIRGMSCVCVSLLCDCVIISVCSTLYFFFFRLNSGSGRLCVVVSVRSSHASNPIQHTHNCQFSSVLRLFISFQSLAICEKSLRAASSFSSWLRDVSLTCSRISYSHFILNERARAYNKIVC